MPDCFKNTNATHYSSKIIVSRVNSVNVVMSKSNTGDGPYVAPERLAMAEPGGLPWRKNLIEKS